MYEPWIERVIREAGEAGKLDASEGAGKPIAGLDRPYDPAWWARRWMQRERRRDQTIELLRHIDQELPRVLAGTVEHKIRAGLESLNTEISEHNASSPGGDAIPLLDVDRLLEERSSRRGG